MQVSRSKKWASQPVLDEAGNPLLNAKGKPVLKPSYSVLQDDFFRAMRSAGYDDVERGERGSTEEHLTVTQFKVAKETERLAAVTVQADKQKKRLDSLQKELKTVTTVGMTVHDIEAMGKKAALSNNVVLTQQECRALKDYAINSFAERAEKLKYKQKYEDAAKDASIWKRKYLELREKAQRYLDALEIASEKARAFLSSILTRGKQEEKHNQPARKREQELER